MNSAIGLNGCVYALRVDLAPGAQVKLISPALSIRATFIDESDGRASNSKKPLEIICNMHNSGSHAFWAGAECHCHPESKQGLADWRHTEHAALLHL
jgi:hypothetical protein